MLLEFAGSLELSRMEMMLDLIVLFCCVLCLSLFRCCPVCLPVWRVERLLLPLHKG